VTFTVNGSSDYTYQFDGHPEVAGTDNTPVTITGLSAGDHILRVWDNCGLVEEKIVITNGTNGLAFTATTENEILSCFNELTGGSITLTVTNGTPNYQYRYDGGLWNNFTAGSATVTINNLHAGIYRVEVKDAAGCTYEVNRITIDREIYTPISIGTIFAAVEPTCGQSNGEIQVYVTGGSGEYQFSVNGGSFETYPNGKITGLAANTYTITVQDANFTTCSTASIHNFVLPNAETDLIVKMTSEDAQTCVSQDGTLHITVTGGKTPYTYHLDGTEVFPTNGMILNKPAGIYVLNVTDSEGCVATSGEVRISATNSQLALDIIGTEDTDCGSTTGIITFKVTGSSSYTYQLDGYPEVSVTNNNPITLTGIAAGIHTLKVWDSCAEVEKEIIIISNGHGGLAFTAEATKEIVSCEGEVISGSIKLTVTAGTPDFKYRYDGGDWINFVTNSYTTTIPNLQAGIYKVEVIDASNCTYEVNGIEIIHESSFGTVVTPPVATSPQTFCNTATVANLQATGVNIRWYLTEEGGNALDATEILINGHIYYAAQALGTCESIIRTAVKVIIDNEVVLETPIIKTPQLFCGSSETLTIADIATSGNTNIVWYDEAIGGNKLSLTDPLEEGFYYATIEVGTCQSAPRIKVEIIFTTNVPIAPVVETPQSFCEGALIGNIAVPNNKVIWYATQTGGTPLPVDYVLQHNTTYYAAQVAGECESTQRTPVVVELTAPEAPSVPSPQVICGKLTLADLTVTGGGIVWYDAAEGGNQLALNTPLEVGKSYWAAQSSVNCEGARAKVTITDNCYVVYGTMFPFVKTLDPVFDAKFPVTVKLHNVPPKDGKDPIETLLKADGVHTTHATYYDASIHIPGTPLNPGEIGNTNNPGLPIDWESIGRTIGTVDNTEVAQGQEPTKPVGMFKFENVVPGEYVIEISRQGYLTRWGKIEITENGATLGHRELIAGDMNDDLQIDASDISNLLNAIAGDNNDPRYDLNGDGNVNQLEIQIIQYNINAYIGIYTETMEWAIEY
ncbi:MAG: hypothetical protein LBI45_05785, partial [Bacteroidales bacterium]|nr:hypothetical protein [Bacteroidales bacterium]